MPPTVGTVKAKTETVRYAEGPARPLEDAERDPLGGYGSLQDYYTLFGPDTWKPRFSALLEPSTLNDCLFFVHVRPRTNPAWHQMQIKLFLFLVFFPFRFITSSMSEEIKEQKEELSAEDIRNQKIGYIMTNLASLAASLGGTDLDFRDVAATARAMYITPEAPETPVERASNILTVSPEIEHLVKGVTDQLSEAIAKVSGYKKEQAS